LEIDYIINIKNDDMDNYNLIERQNDGLFFSPGDVVVLKQNLGNKPIMMVKTIDRASELHEKPKLIGVTCMWFNLNQDLQTARFSTKDLQHYGEQ
jgi:uncharacterized protein YodC (DUF2158 family)